MRNAAYEKVNPRDRTQGRKDWWQKNKDMARLRASPNFARWRKQNRAKRMEWEANYRRTETYRAKNRINQNNYHALKAGAHGSHTLDEFNAVLIAQAYRCFYCGIDISSGATQDHFIPLSKGGSNWIENIRAACITCNISKGNRSAPSKMGGSN
jgi:5-methylcytosine-specific restriction endonuclease McrA